MTGGRKGEVHTHGERKEELENAVLGSWVQVCTLGTPEGRLVRWGEHCDVPGVAGWRIWAGKRQRESSGGVAEISDQSDRNARNLSPARRSLFWSAVCAAWSAASAVSCRPISDVQLFRRRHHHRLLVEDGALEPEKPTPSRPPSRPEELMRNWVASPREIRLSLTTSQVSQSSEFPQVERFVMPTQCQAWQ